MFKFFKLLIAAIVCAAAAVTAVKAVNNDTDGIKQIIELVNSAVQTKRNELISLGVFHDGITVNGFRSPV